MTTPAITLALQFTVTPSSHGPVVRVHVDELARATGLDCQPVYGAALVDRDLAVAIVALAGGAREELRAIGEAFERARTAPVARESATMPAVTDVAQTAPARIAPVHTMRPATAQPAPAQAHAPAPQPAQAPAAQPTLAMLTADREKKERAAIISALDKTHGNKVKAAALLGIPRRTFYRRLMDYGFMTRTESEAGGEAEHDEASEPARKEEPALPALFHRKPGRPRKAG